MSSCHAPQRRFLAPQTRCHERQEEAKEEEREIGNRLSTACPHSLDTAINTSHHTVTPTSSSQIPLHYLVAP